MLIHVIQKGEAYGGYIASSARFALVENGQIIYISNEIKNLVKFTMESQCYT